MTGVMLSFLCTFYVYTHGAYVDYLNYIIDFVLIFSLVYELYVCVWYVICDFKFESFDFFVRQIFHDTYFIHISA